MAPLRGSDDIANFADGRVDVLVHHLVPITVGQGQLAAGGIEPAGDGFFAFGSAFPQALFEFVADQIRYVNYTSGEFWLPNRPHQLLARREGDCDDKAILLITLLRAVGIEAQEVLVQEQEAARKEKELQATVVKPAEAERQASILRAEGQKQATVIKAEATQKELEYEGAGEAAKIERIGKAEAAKILAVGEAEAEVIKRKLPPS